MQNKNKKKFNENTQRSIKIISQCMITGVLMLSDATVFALTHKAQPVSSVRATAPVADIVNNSEQAQENIYTENKTNIVVTAKQPEFVLKLKSNSTTGFSWFLREYDATLITPVKHVYQPPTSTLIGAPGYEIWTFKVKPESFAIPHETNIRMIYQRPWEGSDNATLVMFSVAIEGNK